MHLENVTPYRYNCLLMLVDVMLLISVYLVSYETLFANQYVSKHVMPSLQMIDPYFTNSLLSDLKIRCHFVFTYS